MAGTMKITTISILGLVAVAVFVWLFEFVGPGGAVDKKAIYAEMQGIELQYRQKQIVTPLLLKTASGLELVGLRTEDKQFPYVWVALTQENSEAPEGVFAVGTAAPAGVDCKQVDGILAKGQTSTKVAAYLKNHCMPMSMGTL